MQIFSFPSWRSWITLIAVFCLEELSCGFSLRLAVDANQTGNSLINETLNSKTIKIECGREKCDYTHLIKSKRRIK